MSDSLSITRFVSLAVGKAKRFCIGIARDIQHLFTRVASLCSLYASSLTLNFELKFLCVPIRFSFAYEDFEIVTVPPSVGLSVP